MPANGRRDLIRRLKINITYFFHQLCTLFYITAKKTEKQIIFNLYKYIMIRTTYIKFQTSTTFTEQRNVTFDCEIKQHIWGWKDKEDCPRSEVPYVTLIIWMTVATTWNKAQLCHWSVTIFWHNPTAPWRTCLI